jgi:hypothetical protein
MCVWKFSSWRFLAEANGFPPLNRVQDWLLVPTQTPNQWVLGLFPQV